MAQGEPARAAESLREAVRMANETGGKDATSKALLALARLRANDRFDARSEAERLQAAIDMTDGQAALALAELSRALNERDRLRGEKAEKAKSLAARNDKISGPDA